MTDYLISILVIYIIILMFFVFLFTTIYKLKHYPKDTLSERQKEVISQYGLLHFTLQNNVPSIILDGEIKPFSKYSMSRKEKDLVWFLLGDEHIEDIIPSRFKLLCRNRPNCSVCILITEVSKNDVEKMLYHKKKDYYAHKGSVSCQNARYFQEENGKWIEKNAESFLRES